MQKDRAVWSEVDIVGEAPAKRYGHSLTFTSPFVVLFGGNTGNVNMNDSWSLNIDKQPFVWTKLDCKGDIPAPRVSKFIIIRIFIHNIPLLIYQFFSKNNNKKRYTTQQMFANQEQQYGFFPNKK